MNLFNIFLFIYLYILSEDKFVDSSESDHTHHSNGFTGSDKPPNVDFSEGISENDSIYPENGRNIDPPLEHGTSASFVGVNENNSNNLPADASGNPGNPSAYQDPRYLIANQGKLPPESFEYTEDEFHELYNSHTQPEEFSYPQYPDPSDQMPTASTSAQAEEAQANPFFVPQTQFGEPPPTETPNVTTTQIKLLLLDVNYRETTPDVILYEQEGTNTHIFSAYDPYYIKVVVQGYDLLWEATSNSYPIGVIFYEAGDQSRLDLVYEELAPVPPPPVPSYKPRVIDTLPFMPQQPAYPEPSPVRAPAPQPKPPPQPSFSPLSQQSKISQPATHQASQPRQAVPVAASQQQTSQKPLIKPKFLTVSLDTLKSSREVKYTYDLKKNRHTLKAIYPHLFKEVVSDGKVIWTAKGDRYGNKVVVKYDDQGNRVTKMFYPDQLDRHQALAAQALAQPPAQPAEDALANLDPRDITVLDQPAHFPAAPTGSGLKFYSTFSKDAAVEMSSDQYEVEEFNDSTFSIFTKGVSCVVVEYDDQTLWKRGEHEIVDPKTVSLDPRRNLISVGDDTTGIVFKKGPDGIWAFLESYNHALDGKVNHLGFGPPVVTPAVDAQLKSTVQERVPEDSISPDKGTPPFKVKTKLKLFIKDPKDPRRTIELATTTFKPAELNKSLFYTYKFDEKATCTAVKYENSFVWQFDSSFPNLYPRAVSWHECYFIVCLKFTENFYKLYRMVGSEHAWRSTVLRSTKTMVPSKIKLYSKDFSRELSPYNYRLRDLGFGFEYALKEGVKCKELKYDNTSVYKYRPTDNDCSYPTVIYLFTDRSGHVLYPDTSFFLESKIKFEPPASATTACAKPGLKLKLFTQDPNDPTNIVELDLFKVKSNQVNNFRFVSHHFDAYSKCSEVKYKDSVVWRYDPSTPSIYPKTVIWHELYHLVAIKFGDNFYKFFIKMGNDTKWRSYALKNNSKLSKTKIRLYTKHESILRELGSNEYEFRNLGFCYEFAFLPGVKCEEIDYEDTVLYKFNNVSDGKHMKLLYVLSNKALELMFERSSFHIDSPSELVLDIGKDVGPEERFSYLQHNKVGTYTPKAGCWFTAVKKGDSVIWSNANTADYATKVVRRPPANPAAADRLKVFVDTGKVFNYSALQEQWSLLFVGLELDLAKQCTTREYTYIPYLDSGVYITRFNTRFVKVLMGVDPIWEAPSDAEYSVRVAREGQHRVSVHLNDGNTRVFTRPEANKPWSLVVVPIHLETGCLASATGFEFKRHAGRDVYRAKAEYVFQSVSDPQGKLVWQAEPAPRPELAIARYCVCAEWERSSRVLTLTLFDGTPLVFNLGTHRHPVTLDVNALAPTEHFYRRVRLATTTFTARGTTCFAFLKDGDRQIWSAANDSEYCWKVGVELLPDRSRLVTIFLADGRSNVVKLAARTQPPPPDLKPEKRSTKAKNKAITHASSP